MNKVLVYSPSEVCRFAEKSPVDFMIKAKEIADYCDSKNLHEPDRRWAYMCKLHAVFVAGYVMGIREERAKRRKREHT